MVPVLRSPRWQHVRFGKGRLPVVGVRRIEVTGSPDVTALASIAMRARDGDRIALDTLIEQAYPAIRRQLLLMGCDYHQNEEITQIVAERIVKNIASLKQAHSVTSWVAGITRNCFNDAIERRVHDRERHVSIDAHPAAESLLTDGWHGAHFTESAILIQQAMSHLTNTNREILTLCAAHDLTMVQIASTLGISTSAAYQRLARALEALRRELSANPSADTP